VSDAWPEQRWVPKAELAVVASEDRVVVLDLDHPDRPPIVLEGTARAIWSAIADGRTTAEINDAVAHAYGVAPERTFADVDAFLADMLIAEIIREG
jgi:hypothetical protein